MLYDDMMGSDRPAAESVFVHSKLVTRYYLLTASSISQWPFVDQKSIHY